MIFIITLIGCILRINEIFEIEFDVSSPEAIKVYTNQQYNQIASTTAPHTRTPKTRYLEIGVPDGCRRFEHHGGHTEELQNHHA